jgi:hypothetical protein
MCNGAATLSEVRQSLATKSASLAMRQTCCSRPVVRRPPASVVSSLGGFGNNMEPLRRYFRALDMHGAATSRRAKLVLVGTGEASPDLH